MNYRLEGLKQEAEEVAEHLRKQGFMNPELEIIGALLFTKYRGEDSKVSEMLENTSNLIADANKLLRNLRNETS